MTSTETTWFRLRDFSLYQINADGVVRIKPNQTAFYYKDHGGELVPLMSPDSTCPFYHLISDSQGRCAVTKADLLDKFILDLSLKTKLKN